MQATLNGTVLAKSDDIVMVDGNPYFPREAMNTEFFRDSRLTTVCGWKGTAVPFQPQTVVSLESRKNSVFIASRGK